MREWKAGDTINVDDRRRTGLAWMIISGALGFAGGWLWAMVALGYGQ